MIQYDYKLTEEICRWSFEIKLDSNPDWDIIFTNPTAGPWKRVEARSLEGVKGEVHRFARDEERPDLVAVNDKLKVILIFEAKDRIENLTSQSQLSKSIRVSEDMAEVLVKIKDPTHWSFRLKYKIFNCLLWGETGHSDTAAIKKMFELHYDILRKQRALSHEIMLGVECKKSPTNDITIDYHLSGNEKLAHQIIKSF